MLTNFKSFQLKLVSPNLKRSIVETFVCAILNNVFSKWKNSFSLARLQTSAAKCRIFSCQRTLTVNFVGKNLSIHSILSYNDAEVREDQEKMG